MHTIVASDITKASHLDSEEVKIFAVLFFVPTKAPQKAHCLKTSARKKGKLCKNESHLFLALGTHEEWQILVNFLKTFPLYIDSIIYVQLKKYIQIMCRMLSTRW